VLAPCRFRWIFKFYTKVNRMRELSNSIALTYVYEKESSNNYAKMVAPVGKKKSSITLDYGLFSS
jgi:hypothetical protein